MSDVKEIDPSGRYVRFDDELGRGAYKIVYRAIDRDLGTMVAWNQIKVVQMDDLQRLWNEIEILQSLNHQNIIGCQAAWVDTDRLSVVFITECMSSGTLRQFLKKAKCVKLKVIKNWCVQILEGLNYLHTRCPPIIHRDIKCDNIFINGIDATVKIGDLGLAKLMSLAKMSVIGTPEFMAPEYYEEKYNEKVDIWAFGLCLLEMITLEYPYSECSNAAQVFRCVSSGKKPRALHYIKDAEILEFIDECLCPVFRRKSAAELLKHPFLLSANRENDADNRIIELRTEEEYDEFVRNIISDQKMVESSYKFHSTENRDEVFNSDIIEDFYNEDNYHMEKCYSSGVEGLQDDDGNEYVFRLSGVAESVQSRHADRTLASSPPNYPDLFKFATTIDDKDDYFLTDKNVASSQKMAISSSILVSTPDLDESKRPSNLEGKESNTDSIPSNDDANIITFSPPPSLTSTHVQTSSSSIFNNAEISFEEHPKFFATNDVLTAAHSRSSSLSYPSSVNPLDSSAAVASSCKDGHQFSSNVTISNLDLLTSTSPLLPEFLDLKGSYSTPSLFPKEQPLLYSHTFHHHHHHHCHHYPHHHHCGTSTSNTDKLAPQLTTVGGNEDCNATAIFYSNSSQSINTIIPSPSMSASTTVSTATNEIISNLIENNPNYNTNTASHLPFIPEDFNQKSFHPSSQMFSNCNYSKSNISVSVTPYQNQNSIGIQVLLGGNGPNDTTIVEFDYNLYNDTPLKVSTEMVRNLNLTESIIPEITNLIQTKIEEYFKNQPLLKANYPFKEFQPSPNDPLSTSSTTYQNIGNMPEIYNFNRITNDAMVNNYPIFNTSHPIPNYSPQMPPPSTLPIIPQNQIVPDPHVFCINLNKDPDPHTLDLTPPLHPENTTLFP